MLRSHKLCNPLSLMTVSTYRASGEMAVRAAFPVVVTCVTPKFWKWLAPVPRSMEYTPNPAAASTISATSPIPTTPHLCCFTTATTAELLEVCGVEGAATEMGITAEVRATACSLWLESRSEERRVGKEGECGGWRC